MVERKIDGMSVLRGGKWLAAAAMKRQRQPSSGSQIGQSVRERIGNRFKLRRELIMSDSSSGGDLLRE